MKGELIYFLAVTVLAAAQTQEQCAVYYGGLVFPEGGRKTVEHGMHWSKTQSELCEEGINSAYEDNYSRVF